MSGTGMDGQDGAPAEGGAPLADKGGPQPARWPRIALVTSLALNLLLAGLIAGALLRGPHGGDGRDGGPGGGPGDEIRDLAGALPPNQRMEMARALRDQREAFAGKRSELLALRERLAASVEAEPFDPGAVKAVLAEQAAFWSGIGDFGRGLLLDRIASMTPAERQAFAAAIREEGMRRKERDRHGFGDRDDDGESRGREAESGG